MPNDSLIALQRSVGQAYVAGVAPYANVFAEDITPKYGVCTIRVTVAISVGRKMYLRHNSVNLPVNGDVSLTADVPISFVFEGRATDPFNFRFDGDCTIRKLFVSECDNGVI